MINLERANNLGKGYSEEYKSSKNIEVLKNKDLIYSSMNLGKYIKDDWYWKCGFCSNYTLKPIIDYRCEKCDSKVIKVGEDKHTFYYQYVERYKSIGKLEATANEDDEDSKRGNYDYS